MGDIVNSWIYNESYGFFVLELKMSDYVTIKIYHDHVIIETIENDWIIVDILPEEKTWAFRKYYDKFWKCNDNKENLLKCGYSRCCGFSKCNE